MLNPWIACRILLKCLLERGGEESVYLQGGGDTRSTGCQLNDSAATEMIKRCRGLQHRQIYRIKREEFALILKVPLHVKSSTAISLAIYAETRGPDTVRKYLHSHSTTELFIPVDQKARGSEWRLLRTSVQEITYEK